METIETPRLLRSARILRRLEETCCLSNFSEKPSADADVKNSQGVNNSNNSNNYNNNLLTHSYMVSRYSYLIQIIFTQLYGFKYSNLIQIM